VNFIIFFLLLKKNIFQADGIAMGSASSAGSKLEMQMLVFVAIMLHKVSLNFYNLFKKLILKGPCSICSSQYSFGTRP